MRKLFIIIVTVWMAAMSAWAQTSRWNSVYQGYIDQYKELAIEQMLKYRIPASITLAQGLLESGAGRSSLAVKGNNHFGIKCHDWTGRTMHKDDDYQNECFRAYDNARQSYEDHSLFLAQHRRYASLFQLKITDYIGWANGLKRCGYATSPTYAQTLIGIIETYNLTQYDRASSYDPYIAQKAGKDKPANQGGVLHPIYRNNDNYYLKARKGDTFQSIGKEVGISAKKLAEYNERDRHDQLREGDIVYLKKKRKHASKEFKGHVHIVQPGESMYLISQIYGIRLKNLYKLNGMSPDATLHVNDRLRVY